jgi:hypothetical protein
MKNLSRKLCVGLFSLCILLTGGGCIDIDWGQLENEDVSNKEPYSQFVGKKYRLKKDCYLTKSNSGYYIHVCGKNDAPAELNEKYIGAEIRGGIIVALLPKGTEFIIKKIKFTYSDGAVIFIRPFVEITSNKIIASAVLLVRGDPSTLVFEDGCAEMVDPEPEKK